MVKRRWRIRGLGIGLAVIGAWACGTTSGTSGPATPSPDATAMERAVRADSVRTSYTTADVDFMRGMIHHHAQALVMGRMAPDNGASPGVSRLAARIINGQRDEIETMQRWLRDRGEEVPRPEATGGPGIHDMGHMPGMLSDEELANLEAARGEEFDRLFLIYMIDHHQGAITMVDELLANEGAARDQTVFRLASDIAADQAAEIDRMQSMLRDRLFGAESRP